MEPASPSNPPSSKHPSESQALSSLKRNAKYLLDPTSTTTAPPRFRTRTLLKTLRYTPIFIFWRLVRYAKYALVGSIAAALAGTVFGSVVSGAAFIVAPTGIFAGAGVGLLWGFGKFGWRTLGRRVRGGNIEGRGVDARRDERGDSGEDGHGKGGEVKAPRMDPW